MKNAESDGYSARQRLGRVRAHQRVHGRDVEGLDVRRLLHLDIGDGAVAMDVERDDHVPLHDHRGLRHEPVALHLCDESPQPWAEVDALAVELNEPLRVAAALRVVERLLLHVALQVAQRVAQLPVRTRVSRSSAPASQRQLSGRRIIDRDGSLAAICPSASAFGGPARPMAPARCPCCGGASSASSRSRELPRANGSGVLRVRWPLDARHDAVLIGRIDVDACGCGFGMSTRGCMNTNRGDSRGWLMAAATGRDGLDDSGQIGQQKDGDEAAKGGRLSR